MPFRRHWIEAIVIDGGGGFKDWVTIFVDFGIFLFIYDRHFLFWKRGKWPISRRPNFI